MTREPMDATEFILGDDRFIEIDVFDLYPEILRWLQMYLSDSEVVVEGRLRIRTRKE